MAADHALFRGASGKERARRVLEHMEALDVPPAPANYEIWATYAGASIPELNRELDEHVGRGDPFTDDVNEALHERYFANTRLAVQILETSESIAGELDDVAGALAATSAGARQSASSFAAAAEQASALTDPGALRDAAAQLAAAAHEAAQQQERMAAQVEGSARQIAEMRSALQAIKLEGLTDGLTGLANRKLFIETLSNRIAEAAADRTPLCVLAFDIDDFSRVAGMWGQQIGEQFIRYVGAVLREHGKGDTLAARLDGDRFAMIAPRTRLDLAEAMAARIGRAAKAKQLTRKSTGDAIGAISLSAGVACYRDPEDADALIRRAIDCLDTAKQAGAEQILTDLKRDRARSAA